MSTSNRRPVRFGRPSRCWHLVGSAALVGTTLLLATAGDVVRAAPPQGVYTGTTSQGYSISIDLAGNSVTFTGGYNYVDCQDYEEAQELYATGSLSGSSFTAVRPGAYEVISVNGSIDDSGNASGTFSGGIRIQIFDDPFHPTGYYDCDIDVSWSATSTNPPSTTSAPTTAAPTTAAPTTADPTTAAPATAVPGTTAAPTTAVGPTTSLNEPEPSTPTSGPSTPVPGLPGVAGPVAVIDDSLVAAGQDVTVGATGFQPGETVTAVLHSTPRSLGTIAADSNGAVEITFEVLASDPPGDHRVVFTGPTTGSVSVALSIAGSETLPATGAPVTPVAITAGALIAAGLAIIARVGTPGRRLRGHS